MLQADGLMPLFSALYGEEHLSILGRPSSGKIHANDTTNHYIQTAAGNSSKYYLRRNGFDGVTFQGVYTFEEAIEIIISYELPLRIAHHVACHSFGQVHAHILPFNPALITLWHGNMPTRERMLLAECLQPSTRLGMSNRRAEAEAAVYSGAESPFAQYIMRNRVSRRKSKDRVRSQEQRNVCM